MRAAAFGWVLLAAGAATAAQGEVRVVDAAGMPFRTASLLVARLDPPAPAGRYEGRLALQFGHVSSIRTVAGGVDASPFVTALPSEMWHGRLRRFGAANGTGFSGTAARARSVGFSGLQSEKHVSGFLASELRYGIKLDGDDLLTGDLSVASQRITAVQAIGRGKAIHVSSLYLGAALVHDRRLSVAGGWYRLGVSGLAPLEYAIERTAGMPASGQGVRLAIDWRLDAAAPAPARLGLEMRDGDADRDRLVRLGPATGRERRLLLRFTEPF